MTSMMSATTIRKKAVAMLLPVAAACIASTGFAGTVSYDGKTYEVVDWTSASDVTHTATGTAGSLGVTFTTTEIDTSTITFNDYSADPAFDAITYNGSSIFENITFFGAVGAGTFDTLSFTGGQVDSVLLIIGAPNQNTDPQQYGPSRWDFADDLTLTVVDEEGGNGFDILAGNILNNADTTGPNNHRSGIIRVDGDAMSSLDWQHVLGGSNTDKMRITFAVSVVPVPAAVWLFVSALGLLGWTRRQQTR